MPRNERMAGKGKDGTTPVGVKGGTSWRMNSISHSAREGVRTALAAEAQTVCRGCGIQVNRPLVPVAA